jgi:hypothetical protein
VKAAQIEVLPMGGRSRQFKPTGRWDFIKELSDERLHRYGVMSSKKYDAALGWESAGKSALNFEAAKEFERRHGEKPYWYVKD